MRVHIQNPAADDLFAITPAQWDAACARAGESGHRASFAADAAGFAAAIGSAEVLIAQPGTVRALLPFAAPDLRILFCTAAGLDRLMPFDWLPPRLVLINNRGVHGAKMADYAAMALLMLNARVPAFADAQRRQRLGAALRAADRRAARDGDRHRRSRLGGCPCRPHARPAHHGRAHPGRAAPRF